MTQRAESRLAGIAYLAYIVLAMSAAVLSGKTMGGADTSQRLATLRSMLSIAQVTVLLDLLQIVCAVVLAVTLYRLSRTVNITVALLAMTFREGITVFPLLGKLELMRLATASNPSCASSAGCLAIAGEVFTRPDDLFGQFCFVVGGFLFAYLLLVGRLIPRWMAWTGVITIGLQLLCVPLYVATLLPGKVVSWLWFPILLYEVPLGCWLTFQGIQIFGQDQ